MNFRERQSGILTPEMLARTKVVVIGVGATGSWTALALSKMGFGLHVVDPDIVEPHNVGGQAYAPFHVGCKKPSAMAQLSRMMAAHTVGWTDGEWSDYGLDGMLSPRAVLICCVDNMAARAQIVASMDRWLPEWKPKLYIDTRVGFNYLTILTAYPHEEASWAEYKKSLFTDEEAVTEPCGARMLASTAITVAGITASMVKAHYLRILAPAGTSSSTSSPGTTMPPDSSLGKLPGFTALDLSVYLAQGWDGAGGTT